eukprot:TRINITY_DN9400_c0_g1_i2.p1 TRINITY_DN9400_c0_g1~~TRINITY_DN9400_c0_g1_i2.p1  ORF type:complete len:116 (-),score=16.90 TRINITY_DN9400_c0_g1_i2:224-571(-)
MCIRDSPRTVLHRKGELITEKRLPEPQNYEEIARQGMELVRAIGPRAARILKDARKVSKKVKRQVEQSSKHILSTPMKSTREQSEATPSKSTADTMTRKQHSKFNKDISAVYARL